ncbi:glycosyltransferase [Escherichia coli]|uniref:glycosyltransferase n=1 Tax=Escherichia coli TaxID=562 RepID=UPI00333B9521
MSKDNVYKYPDQDVMNVLLKGMTIFLPRGYNTIYTIKSELKTKTHQNYKKADYRKYSSYSLYRCN